MHWWNTSLADSSPFLTSTGLLLLACPYVSLTNRMHIVTAFDFEQLTKKDVNHIAGTTLAYLGITCFEDHKECFTSCALDIFCAFTFSSDTFGLDSVDTPAAVTIVRHLQSYHLFSWGMATMPNFPIFITSDLFPSISWSLAELKGICHFVSCAVHRGDAARSESHAKVLMSIFSRILTRTVCLLGDRLGGYPAWTPIVHAMCNAFRLPLSQPGSARTSSQHPIAHWLPDHITEHASPSSVQDPLFQNGPLALLLPLDNQSSMWQQLTEDLTLNTHSCISDVADILASQLCTCARQGIPDVSALIQAFFAQDFGLALLQLDESEAQKIDRVIQHCMELRPDWWPALLSRMDPFDDRRALWVPIAEAHAKKIERRRLRRGTSDLCTVCPPRGTVLQGDR